MFLISSNPLSGETLPDIFTKNQRMENQNLGSLTKRIIAAVIDYSIILTVTFYMIFMFGTPSADNPETYEITGWKTFIPILFWFTYTVIIEQFLGATLGNGIVGIKPIDISGFNRKPDFFQSMKRHLLDPIDLFFFGLVGIILITNSEKKQRLGDMWAKTIVIKHIEK